MNNKIKVSIVLTTYKGGRFIGTAVQSVLAQTFRDYELLVLDDSPDEEIAQILRGFKGEERIIYRRNETRLGFQGSLNRGINLANGEYIARLDDDDAWIENDKLARQVEFLNNNREHVLVGTGVVVVDENGAELARSLMPENDRDIRQLLLEKNCFIHSSVVFRKSTALDAGGYHEDKHPFQFEDYQLWLELGTRGKLANLPIYGTSYTLRKRRGGIYIRKQILPQIRTVRMIGRYKNKYPHYRRAVLLKIIGVFRVWLEMLADTPPFVYLKRFLISKFPAGWRLLTKVNGGIIQAMKGIIRLFT